MAAMNVIVINDSAALAGGIDRVALAEAAGLAERSHRVTLIAGAGQPDADLANSSVTVHTTGQPTTLGDPNRLRAGVRGVWNRRARALVRDVIAGADRRATVVHVHGYGKVLSASVVRAAVESGLPTVATLHEYSVACPNGAFYNYPRGEICHLTPLSPSCIATHCDARAYSHKLWRVGRTAVQQRFGRMPSGVRHFIAPSGFTADILRPYVPEEAHIHVLANPIEVKRMAPVDPAINDPFVFVGRLQRDKGGVLFARAARIADVPAVFIGVGDDEKRIREANPDAELLGWQPSPGVQSGIRAARAVVSASLLYETQGLVPLEAAAHGVPTIVSDQGVPREAVVDGTTGLWFRGGDVDDLAEKLMRLSLQPPLARRLGEAAYDRFWSGNWDLCTHLNGLESIYRLALD